MKLLVIHGPNLGMLGKRDPKHYGSLTLQEIYDALEKRYPMVVFTFFQSNHEGKLIDYIESAFDKDYQGLIINPGALTHQSIALRDALEILPIKKVEVHLSDLMNREDFRRINYIKDVCDGHFMGKKLESYFEAVNYFL